MTVSGALADLFVRLTLKDDLTKPLDEATKTAGSLTGRLQSIGPAATAFGAGLTAIGGAATLLVDANRQMNASFESTALSMGAPAASVKELARSLQSVDSPIEEVAGTLDVLARAGMENVESMGQTATAFDNLADGIGTNADTLTGAMVPAFNALGVELAKAPAYVDGLATMFRRSNVDVSDFSQAMSRAGPDLGAMGLGLQDVEAILMSFADRGITGRKAMSELTGAIKEADGSAAKLYASLGISADELAGYNEELTNSTGAAQAFADAANSQFGVLDKLKFKFTEIKQTAGDLLAPLEGLTTAFLGLGPALMGLGSLASSDILPTLAGMAQGFLSVKTPMAEVIGMSDEVIDSLHGINPSVIGDLLHDIPVSSKGAAAALDIVTDSVDDMSGVIAGINPSTAARAFDAIGDSAKVAGSGVASGLLGSLKSGLAGLPTALSGGLGSAFAGLSGAVGSGLAGLSGIFSGFGAMVLPLLTNPITIAIGAIAALGAGIVLLDSKFHFLGPTLQWFKDTLGGIADWFGATFGPIIGGIIGWFNELGATLGGSGSIIQDVLGWFEDLGTGAAALGKAIGDVLGPAIRDFATWFGQTFGPALKEGIGFLAEFVGYIGGHFVNQIADFVGLLKAGWDALGGWFEGLSGGRSVIDVLATGFGILFQYAGAAWEKLVGFAAWLGEKFQPVVKPVLDALGWLGEKLGFVGRASEENAPKFEQTADAIGRGGAAILPALDQYDQYGNLIKTAGENSGIAAPQIGAAATAIGAAGTNASTATPQIAGAANAITGGADQVVTAAPKYDAYGQQIETAGTKAATATPLLSAAGATAAASGTGAASGAPGWDALGTAIGTAGVNLVGFQRTMDDYLNTVGASITDQARNPLSGSGLPDLALGTLPGGTSSYAAPLSPFSTNGTTNWGITPPIGAGGTYLWDAGERQASEGPAADYQDPSTVIVGSEVRDGYWWWFYQDGHKVRGPAYTAPLGGDRTIPHFAEGGIYAGSDDGLAFLHSGEAVLTPAQQQTVAGAIGGGGLNEEAVSTLRQIAGYLQQLIGVTQDGSAAIVRAQKSDTDISQAMLQLQNVRLAQRGGSY